MHKSILIITIALTLICIFTVSASATTYPEVPIYDDAFVIVVETATGEYQLYRIFNSYSEAIGGGEPLTGYNFNVTTNTNNEYVLEINRSEANVLKPNYAYKTYNVVDGQWEQVTQKYDITHTSTTQFGSIKEFLYSSVDLYKDGELFFPLPPKPLYQVVAEVGVQSLQNTAVPEVTSAMTTLTLCGVGLIALLAVLPLFGKIFHRYRS